MIWCYSAISCIKPPTIFLLLLQTIIFSWIEIQVDCTANIKPNTYLTSSNIHLLLFSRFILGWSLAFWEWLWCCYWWPLWSWCVETSRRSLTSIPWCLRAPCQIVIWWEISLPLLVMGPLSPPNCMTNQSTKRALPYITNPIGKAAISCLFTIIRNMLLIGAFFQLGWFCNEIVIETTAVVDYVTEITKTWVYWWNRKTNLDLPHCLTYLLPLPYLTPQLPQDLLMGNLPVPHPTVVTKSKMGMPFQMVCLTTIALPLIQRISMPQLILC